MSPALGWLRGARASDGVMIDMASRCLEVKSDGTWWRMCGLYNNNGRCNAIFPHQTVLGGTEIGMPVCRRLSGGSEVRGPLMVS